MSHLTFWGGGIRSQISPGLSGMVKRFLEVAVGQKGTKQVAFVDEKNMKQQPYWNMFFSKAQAGWGDPRRLEVAGSS